MNIFVKGNKLEFNGKTYDCAIGKNGFSANKIEGDNCTPFGEFGLRELYYRADKLPKPETILKTTFLQKNDGWCDAPGNDHYNRHVVLPFPASCEKLWRDDDLYNLIVPLGYNDDPVVTGKGSAIFLHIAKPAYAGTEGCVALKQEDLLEVLSGLMPTTKIIIAAQ